jgi:hypothetical protein
VKNLADVILGTIFVLLGVLVFKKSDKWVKKAVDMWPFWKLSGFDVKTMKLMWQCWGIFLIIFGIFSICGLVR